MEKKTHEQNPGEAPRVTFLIGDKQVNIIQALDTHETHLSTANCRPGDVEAQALLRMLGNSLVTSSEYLRTMPKLFEYAAHPAGGFDRDFLAVAFHEFDSTAQYMSTRSLTQLLVGKFWDNEIAEGVDMLFSQHLPHEL